MQLLCPRVSISCFVLHTGLLLFAKHLFFAALVANCLLPGERSDFCHTSRQFELAYGPDASDAYSMHIQELGPTLLSLTSL